ncbi:MAG: sulfate ABC transporter permease subunit CysW [Planctomycetaceae bacterium]|nr:sulfate ABC transporter permease subunit CysW [Planctomycetaceae bacterium]
MLHSISANSPRPASVTEPLGVRLLLIGVALGFMLLFLVMPLLIVFVAAFAEGIKVYFASLVDPHALAALRLTLFTVAIVVPMNLVFGVCAAWCITKFEFYGKSLLITLIDIPFAISPVIAGLLFIVLFGAGSTLGEFLESYNIKIVFATPGIVIATLFVTFPFVARELIPIMQSQGIEEEEAARVLGARGWQIFWRVTLPNIKWALLYGVILCNARAMGEFGAVMAVSGAVGGVSNTLPLHIENVYWSIPSTPAFAVASLLAMLAMFTLLIKTIVEIKGQHSLRSHEAKPESD